LSCIARYRVTHSQWVPTMFVRMLKLPEAERGRHDLSSHRVAIHAAAPCPVEVKRAMIAWWGPLLHEYYAGTESNGSTRIDSAEWLAHPGSVGRAQLGVIHICDDDGRELPAGEAGVIYFEREAMVFAYHNDPEKTRRAQHPDHETWSTLGDVGYLDSEGYLYLTDRKAFMIISGGVNIYPQAIEDALVTHPKVRDAAVIGLPNADLGEEVKAVVEPMDGIDGDTALAEELTAYLRTKVARYMVPKSIDFTEALPRLPTGKLYKHALRAQYLA
jgi:fatty-acyl-CoA synthase